MNEVKALESCMNFECAGLTMNFAMQNYNARLIHTHNYDQDFTVIGQFER